MTSNNDNHLTQHIGGTIMVVMMDVEPEHEAEFNRWYDEEHLVERLEIPGYVSARRFKLEEVYLGDGRQQSTRKRGVPGPAAAPQRAARPGEHLHHAAVAGRLQADLPAGGRI